MRLRAFDNMRLASIFMVTAFHTMCGYNWNVRWWYVHISDDAIRYGIFIAVIDTYLMALMFFAAGFFAQRGSASITSIGQYFKVRFKRLLVPGYLQLLLVCPFIFVFADGIEFSPSAIAAHFLKTWSTLANIKFEAVPAGSMGFHHHIWFVEALFVIGGFFVLIRPFTRTFFSSTDTNTKVIAGKLLGLICIAQLLTWLTLQLGFNQHQWQNFGGLAVVQPVRMGSYLCAFGAGMYFSGCYGRVPLKQLAQGSAIAIVLYLIIFQVGVQLVNLFHNKSMLSSFVIAYYRIAFCFFALLLTTMLFLKFFAAEYRWLKPLYPLNYGIYLMHMVYVVALQKLFMGGSLPIDAQVAIITAGAFSLSIASTYLKQRLQTSLSQSNSKLANA